MNTELEKIETICSTINFLHPFISIEKILSITIMFHDSPLIHVSEEYFDQLFQSQGYYETVHKDNFIQKYTTIGKIKIFCIRRLIIEKEVKFIEPKISNT